MKKNLKLSILLVVLILSACTSKGPQAITIVPPLATATKTPVPSITPTETPTFTPSPTPDLRVMNTKPHLIILTVEELAEMGDYGVNASLEAYKEYSAIYYNPYANLNCTLGADAAAEFLDTTGLVTGWSTHFSLQSNAATLAEKQTEYVVITALIFDSVDGPQKLVESWGRPCEFGFYDYVGEIDIGDKATLCRYYYWMANGELSHTRYRLAIQSRNLYLGMVAYSRDDESMDLDRFYQIAQLQVEKLENQQLVDAVTLDQDFTLGAGCITPPTPVVKREGQSDRVYPMGWCVYDINKHKCFPGCSLEPPDLPPGEGSPDYAYTLMPCVYTGEKIIIKDPQN